MIELTGGKLTVMAEIALEEGYQVIKLLI